MTPPPQPEKKKKGRAKRNRGRGCAAKRSRARFNAHAYQNRKRAECGRSGPANPFVMRTDPTIFNKQSRGRKPMSYQQRMEGVQEARQILEDAIEQEKIKPTARGKTKKNKSRRRLFPSRISPTISPIISPIISPTISVSPTISSPANFPTNLANMAQLNLMHAQYMMQMQMFGYLMNPQPLFGTGTPNPFQNPDSQTTPNPSPS